jgi:hypothetical protein
MYAQRFPDISYVRAVDAPVGFVQRVCLRMNFVTRKVRDDGVGNLFDEARRLPEGKHEGTVVTVQGDCAFHVELSNTFFMITLKCQGIVQNIKYIDVLVKGKSVSGDFKKILKEDLQVAEGARALTVRGSVEILRDGAKTPVIHLEAYSIVDEAGTTIEKIFVPSEPKAKAKADTPPAPKANPKGWKRRPDRAKTPVMHLSASSVVDETSTTVGKPSVPAELRAKASVGTPPAPKLKNKGWKRLKKDRRAAKFVNFLVDEFGYDVLNSTEVGVLDVAGGKGEVSFELGVRRGIASVVIDPRPVRITTKQEKLLRFRKESQRRLSPAIHFSPLARFLVKTRYPAKKLKQRQGWFYESFGTDSSNEEEAELLEQCTIIVGMHPDGATDPIMKVAIREQKPWAIVPCCVFPSQFPHRRKPDGGEVRSYEDYCEYILNIAPGGKVKEKVLDFEGRNRCFYYHPPSLSSDFGNLKVS